MDEMGKEMKRKPIVDRERRLIIRQLTKKYGLRCWYCGIDLEKKETHLDHILSVAEGGTDKINNLALSCKFCNSHKFYYPITDFLKYLAHTRTGHFSCPILEQFEDKIERRTYDILQKSFWR